MNPSNEFQTSMLDDILATEKGEESHSTGTLPISLEGTENSPDGFKPLNLAHLSATDWSVVVGALMTLLGKDQITLTSENLASLDAPEGHVTVLACTIHPESSDVRFTLLQSPKSEFRS